MMIVHLKKIIIYFLPQLDNVHVKLTWGEHICDVRACLPLNMVPHKILA